MKTILFAVISFCASVIGSICGLGGGVIIKPAADAFGLFSVSTASFMSGCVVLSMTAYSILRAKVSGTLRLAKGISRYLVIGATVGGVVGKALFSLIKNAVGSANLVGEIQSAALLVLIIGAALYMIREHSIRTHHVTAPAACIAIGLSTGLLSAFLGIGCGPINLVVLYYFFSMNAKDAAQNSLFIILVSQTASLISTIVTGSVPEFSPALLAVSALCGILGGMVGRKINKHIDNTEVEKLFLYLLCAIIIICVYNIYRFAA